MNKFYVQLFAAIIISIPNFLTGFYVSWPSYTLETLTSDKSPFGRKLTALEMNLIGSVPMLGSFVTTVLVGYTESLGRKTTEILVGVCFTISLSIMALAPNVTVLLIGGFINGIGNGIHSVVCMFIIAEYCEVSLRGSLNTITIFTYCFGGLVSFVMGWKCSYAFINYFTLTLSVIFLVLVVWIKETPVHLLGKGKDKEALKNLKFYRGITGEDTPSDVYEEFIQMQKQGRRPSVLEKSDVPSENENLKDQESHKNNKEIKQSAWKILITTNSCKTAVITLSLHVILLVLMGTVAVQSYASLFFGQAAPGISPHLCSIALSVVVAVGSGVSMVISDLVERRVLMITGAVLSSLLLMLLSCLLHWSFAPAWCAPATILLFSFVFQLGPGCVAFVQLTECFVPQVKTLSMIIAMCCMWASNFVVLYGFQPLVAGIGLDGTFLVFACMGFLLTISSALIMKETKGVPLQDINEMFERGYFCRYTNKT